MKFLRLLLIMMALMFVSTSVSSLPFANMEFCSDLWLCQSPMEEEDPDSLLDGSVFQIDDSLLNVCYPEASVKTNQPLASPGVFSHSLRLHITPADSLTGNFLIITTSTLHDSLSGEIQTYAEDVHAVFGYGILLEVVDNATPELLKSVILNYQAHLCGVLLIGSFRACMFETEKDYDKASYGYKKWPCDLYFMDLDGIWHDDDANGVYDRHTGNVRPEIFFARLTADGMSYLGDEVEILRRQLHKSHAFWWKSSMHRSDTVLNYIDKTWLPNFPSSEIKVIFPGRKVDDVRYGSGSPFSPSDYLSRLGRSKYGFTHIAVHSSPTRHALTNGNIYPVQIQSVASYNYVFNLFSCSACNWKGAGASGYLGGSYLFNEGQTLAVVGSTKTGGMRGQGRFYSQLAANNVGMSLLRWWQNYHGNSHPDKVIWWSYGMTILGDPTILVRHQVGDLCSSSLSLATYPSKNHSNLVLYRASETIHVGSGFTIPSGVHVVFDAPEVIFEPGFSCPSGASFETRSEGCEL